MSGAAAARDPAAGVTLVETLVVLALVGILAGAAALGLGGLGGAAPAAAEAQRLAAALALAADTALLEGRAVLVAWDARGYRIGAASRRDLPAAVTLRPADGPAGGQEGRLQLAADGTSPAAAFLLAGGGGAWRVEFDGLTARALPAEADR
jgi:general secretion pathway protein H